MNKSKTDGKKSPRKTPPPRRTAPPSPRTERGTTQGDSRIGKRSVKVNWGTVSNVETDDSSEE